MKKLIEYVKQENEIECVDIVDGIVICKPDYEGIVWNFREEDGIVECYAEFRGYWKECGSL